MRSKQDLNEVMMIRRTPLCGKDLWSHIAAGGVQLDSDSTNTIYALPAVVGWLDRRLKLHRKGWRSPAESKLMFVDPRETRCPMVSRRCRAELHLRQWCTVKGFLGRGEASLLVAQPISRAVKTDQIAGLCYEKRVRFVRRK